MSSRFQAFLETTISKLLPRADHRQKISGFASVTFAITYFNHLLLNKIFQHLLAPSEMPAE